MPRILLHAGRLHAEIDTDLGAALTDFSIDGPHSDRYPLLRRSPRGMGSPAQASCFLLAPWPNRVRDARFVFAGRERTLRVNFPDGTAIHGEAWDRPWTIADRSPVHARLAFDSRQHDAAFPWPFGAVFRAELSPAALELELSVTNLSDEPMPAGCGLHPYFPRRLFSEADAVTLRAPVTGRYPAKACLPTGPAASDPLCRTLSEGVTLTTPERSLDLDDCFAGFGGRAEIAWPASGVTLTMDSSPESSHLVVFTPHERGAALPWFCVEPVTMANDAFNLATAHPDRDFGVRVLAPGETLTARTTLHVATER